MNARITENADYLIVGQGLAGSLLAHFLLAENQKIRVLDYPHSGATSCIAAGVINPVTGRRIAKSWRFEELFPFAKKTYLELEQILGIRLWREPNILRALFTVFEENEWMRRSAFPDYQPYFETSEDLGNYEGKVKNVRSWGELRNCAQVAMPELIAAFRQYLLGRNLLIEDNFDFNEIEIKEGGVAYKAVFYKKIIFCEGARAIQNPYFNYLPFSPTKGELLIVRIPGAGFEKMLKHHVFIVPLKDDLYWVGSTSRFEYEGDQPTEEKRQWLISQLADLLTIPFEVVAHHAGIRPTVTDIRPFLGLHPEYPSLAIFNGLGTKGASLGPFFARHRAVSEKRVVSLANLTFGYGGNHFKTRGSTCATR